MAAATFSVLDKWDLSPTMQYALMGSLLLHVFILVGSMIGLPYVQRDIIPPPPIMIEIVDISDVTTTDRKPSTNRPKKPTVDEAPKAEKKVKVAPKVDAKEPPKIDPLKKVDVKKDVEKPEPTTPPPPTEKKLEKPKEKPKKKPKKRAAAVPEEDPLNSLLKNLQDEEVSNGESEEKKKPAQQKAAPDAPIAPKLTASQIDAIRAALSAQFAGCWGVVAGARNAEYIAVTLLITVNPDRTVQNVRIKDQWRYNQDSFFRAAADSARRAVYHPDCKVLDLPPDHYNEWKELEFNFNPAEML